MKIVLVGPHALAAAWRRSFENSDVAIMDGDIIEAAVGGALVSPANSFGWMDGGLDQKISDAYRDHNVDITALAQAAIRERAGGELPVGQALVLPTPQGPYTHLVVAPTMRTPRPVRRSLNAYLAFRAVLLAADAWDRERPENPIETLFCPGLCTGIGRMPAGRAARQMRAAWDAVRNREHIPSLIGARVREDALRLW